MDFAGKHPIEGRPVAKLRALNAKLPFLLITTGVARLSGSVHGPVRERWLKGDPEVVKGMERIAELGRAGAFALEESDWLTLGKAMDENHQIVARLGGSGDRIDDLIKDCKKCGAISAKLAGAGLGGTVIALTGSVDDLKQRLSQVGYSRFCIPTEEPGLNIHRAI